MWNSSILTAPPVNTFKAKSPLIDINAVASVLNSAIKVLNSLGPLELESKLVSRCVYRMKLKFRNDKGFKVMEKTVKVLKRLLNFNILSDLKGFLNALPHKYEKDFYLPTKQMLEYILVRIQGFSKMLCYIVECSKNVAELMCSRLKLGHFWQTAAVVLALISRIWQITKILTEKCCSWFNALLPLRDKLEISGARWLPDDYTFPTDLVEWLNVGWMYEKHDVFDKVQFDLPIFSLLDDSDDEVEFCYQYNMNDCFVVEDETFVDNDVQFIGGNLNAKIKNEGDKSLILIEDDDSDIETLINNPDTYICDDSDDIGESISRNITANQIDVSSKSQSSGICNNNGKFSNNNIGVLFKTSNINLNNINNDIPSTQTKFRTEIGESSTSIDNKPFREPLHPEVTIVIDEDVGESVPRKRTEPSNDEDSSAEISPKKMKRKLKKKMARSKSPVPEGTMPNFSTLKQLHKFLKHEHSTRRKDLQKCVTKQISDQRWVQLYYQMSQLKLNAEVNPKKINTLLARATTALRKALDETKK